MRQRETAFDLRESRFGWSVPLLLCAYLLSTTWLSRISWNEAHLDVPFLVAICLSLLGGVERAAWAGALAGFLAALLAVWHPGSFLLSRLAPCLLIGLLSPRLAIFHPLTASFAALIAALVCDAVFVLLSPTEAPISFWVNHAIGFSVLQAIAIWPVFWLCARLVRPRRRLVFG